MRQLADPGHLPGPKLVQDLAGLGVPPRIVLGGLVRGQHLECLDRELRPERQRLERGDERIASEQRREPWHAGGDVALIRARTVVDQQAQVRDRALDDEVEQLVVALHCGRAALPGVVGGGALVTARRAGRAGRAQQFGAVRGLVLGRRRRRSIRAPRGPAQLADLAGTQLDVPQQMNRRARCRTRPRRIRGPAPPRARVP